MEWTHIRRRLGRHLTFQNTAFAGLAGALALASVWTPSEPIEASDHIDAPILAQDKAADLNDVYAFLDPNDNSQVVIVFTTNPFLLSSEAIGQVIFDHNLRYQIQIENTGDARPDRFLNVTFSQGVGRLEPQEATIRLPDRRRFKAPTTPASQEDTPFPPRITTDRDSGVRFFAGQAEDPFFLDNTAANRFVLSSLPNRGTAENPGRGGPGNPDRSVLQRGRDTYAGFNTLVTVLSVPAAMLRGTSNEIGFNVVTQRRMTQTVQADAQVTGRGRYVTLDRQGGPLINNGLIPPARKDEYNGAPTEDDARGRFQADIVQSLRNLGTNDAHIAMILDVAVRRGDILRLDLTVPNSGPQGGTNPEGGFGKMGGRRLVDDVGDAVFTLINNGVPLGDNVPRNEVPFRDTFPFVQDPAQPFPPGPNPEDRTRL